MTAAMRHMIPAFLALLAIAVPARGQEAGRQHPQEVTAATLEELVATLQDAAAREKLVARLEAMLRALRQEAEPAKVSSVLDEAVAFFSKLTDKLGQTSSQLLGQLQALPEHVRGFWGRLQQPDERAAILADAGQLLAIVLVALLVGLLSWFALRRWHGRLAGERDPDIGPLEKLGRLFGRLLVGLAPSIAMLGVALAGLALLPTTHTGGALALALVSAVAVRRIFAAAFGFLFAADAPRIRLLPLEDELAAGLTRSIGRLTALGVYGWFLLEAVAAIGADAELVDPLRDLYGLLLLIGGIALVLKFRKRVMQPVEAALMGKAESGTGPGASSDATGTPRPPRWRAFVVSIAGLWWVAAVLYMVGVYAIWISDVPDAFGFMIRATLWTLVTLLVASLVLAVIRRLLAGLGRKLERLTTRIPAVQRQVPRYVQIVRIVLEVALWLFAIGLVLESWGVAALQALEGPAVRELISAAVHIVILVLIALALVDLTTALAQRYLEQRERTGKSTAKARTLVPLAQKTIKFVVAVVVGIMVLDRLGVQIGPLLAGVGVLGLAVGFGAQTLVKDIITGVFILLEDTVAVGDVINIDGTGGVVEAINIRTIRLRDLSGNLHTIPYSGVSKITNMTKKFGRYVIDAGVGYNEDVDQVMEVLRGIGDEMQQDPEFGPQILEPIEILGVDRFEDSAVIVRARLTTKPIRQWAVGREFNRRMKKKFDELGIEIPFPHRTIYMGVEKDGKAPPLFVRQMANAAPAGAKPEPPEKAKDSTQPT